MWRSHVPGKNSSWKFNNFIKHLHQSWATCKPSQDSAITSCSVYSVKTLKFLQCILWVILCSSVETTPFHNVENKYGCLEEYFCAKVTPFWGQVVSVSYFQSGNPGLSPIGLFKKKSTPSWRKACWKISWEGGGGAVNGSGNSDVRGALNLKIHPRG